MNEKSGKSMIQVVLADYEDKYQKFNFHDLKECNHTQRSSPLKDNEAFLRPSADQVTHKELNASSL